MNIKKYYRSKENTILSAAAGLIVCLLLFLFYYFVYFPGFQKIYKDETPGWIMIAPTLTGHAFPAFSHFIVEGSPAVPMFCEYKNSVCVQWSAGNSDSCARPLVMEGTAGCCLQQVMTPDEGCREKVEWVGFGIFSVGLFVIYALVGAFLGNKILNRE